MDSKNVPERWRQIYGEHEMVLPSIARMLIEELAEAARRVLIAEKMFELCNESRDRLTRFHMDYERWKENALADLIAEGKIQPTEPGGQK